MKRRAEQDIGEVVNESNEEQVGKVSTPQEIAERKILKIRKGDAPQAQNINLSMNTTELEKPKDQPVGNISFVNPTQQQQGGSIFDNSKIEVKQDNKKPIEVSYEDVQKVADNISKIAEGKEQPKSSGLFNNQPKEEKKEEEKTINTGSIFGEIQKGGSLFGGNNNTSGQSLFGNTAPSNSLFGGESNNQTGNLFQAATETKTSGGLFGAAPATGGLFGAPKVEGEQKGGLFSNVPQQGGLFSNIPQSGQGILNTTTNAGNDGNESDDNAIVSGQNSPKIDKSKQQRFEYKELTDVLVEKSVNKFKRNDGEPIDDQGYISVEIPKDSQTGQAIVIYRNQLKQVIFQGNILKKISLAKNFGNKEQNVMVTTFAQEKDQIKKDTIRLQFTNGPDAKSVIEALKAQIDQ